MRRCVVSMRTVKTIPVLIPFRICLQLPQNAAKKNGGFPNKGIRQIKTFTIEDFSTSRRGDKLFKNGNSSFFSFLNEGFKQLIKEQNGGIIRKSTEGKPIVCKNVHAGTVPKYARGIKWNTLPISHLYSYLILPAT